MFLYLLVWQEKKKGNAEAPSEDTIIFKKGK